MVQSKKFVGAGPRACPNQGDHRESPLHMIRLLNQTEPLSEGTFR